MSTFRVVAIAVTSTVLILGLSAPVLAEGEDADHEALRALKGIYETAVMENKLDRLEPHLHPQFTAVMLTGETVGGYAELTAYWSKMRELIGEGGTYSFELEPDTSLIFGDIALSTGKSAETVVTDSGDSFRFDSGWTAVSQRTADGWKLLRVQGTMDPITNEFVAKGVQAASMTFGGGGLALGLVLGVILRSLIGRKKAE